MTQTIENIFLDITNINWSTSTKEFLFLTLDLKHQKDVHNKLFHARTKENQ
jgi:hypothetical protein